MTTWDSIYKNFADGGEAWATLAEEIHPLFLEWFKQLTFPKHTALDIGCGTGKYLQFLEQNAFKVTGIDSSLTAIEMSAKNLSASATLKCANMFTYQYPTETFGLIISVSTIHHGTKEQIKHALTCVYEALVPKGKIFISLPDFESAKNANHFENHTEIEPNTYAPNTGPETGLAHSFFTKEEVSQLFSHYKISSIELDEIGRWIVTATKA